MILTQANEALDGEGVELACIAQFCVNVNGQEEVLLRVEADPGHLNGDTRQRQLASYPGPQSSLKRILECSAVFSKVPGILRVPTLPKHVPGKW